MAKNKQEVKMAKTNESPIFRLTTQTPPFIESLALAFEIYNLLIQVYKRYGTSHWQLDKDYVSTRRRNTIYIFPVIGTTRFVNIDATWHN